MSPEEVSSERVGKREWAEREGGGRQWNSAINHAKNKCQVIYQRQHAANTSKGSEKSKGLNLLLWSGCIIKRMPRPQSQRHYQCKLRQTDCVCVLGVCIGCVCVCASQDFRRISNLIVAGSFGHLVSHTHTARHGLFTYACVLCLFCRVGGRSLGEWQSSLNCISARN